VVTWAFFEYGDIDTRFIDPTAVWKIRVRYGNRVHEIEHNSAVVKRYESDMIGLGDLMGVLCCKRRAHAGFVVSPRPIVCTQLLE